MKNVETPQRPKESTAVLVIILLAGVVLAVANVAVLLGTVPEPRGTFEASSLVELYRACAPCLIYFVAAPIVIVGLIAIVVGRSAAAAQSTPIPAPQTSAKPAASSAAPALQLLGLLQQEGRFIDFISEDLDAYSDAQVGTAVRSIHAGCRKALNERIELARVYAAEDGSEVTIEPGFDPASVRLTGNVGGGPPFRGTLQHGGWRVTQISLPQATGALDPSIIAPAEVEIP